MYGGLRVGFKAGLQPHPVGAPDLTLKDLLKLIAVALFWLALLWSLSRGRRRCSDEYAAALYYYYGRKP